MLSNNGVINELKKALAFSSVQFKALFTFGMGCTAFYNMAYQFSTSMKLGLSSYEIALTVIAVLSSASLQDVTLYEEKLKNTKYKKLWNFLNLSIKAGIARLKRGIQHVLEIFSFTSIMVPFFTVLRKMFELSYSYKDIYTLLIGLALSVGLYIGSRIIAKLNFLE